MPLPNDISLANSSNRDERDSKAQLPLLVELIGATHIHFHRECGQATLSHYRIAIQQLVDVLTSEKIMHEQLIYYLERTREDPQHENLQYHFPIVFH